MKSDRVYLEQMAEAVKKIKIFAPHQNYQEFENDQKTQSAVIMQLALIGELAKRVSKETQVQINLPWKAIAGFRDKAIHDYYQIDLEIVWTTVKEDLNILEENLQTYLNK